MYIYTPVVSCLLRSEGGVSSMKLELLMGWSQRVLAVNLTQVLCKSNKCSLLSRHLSDLWAQTE